MKKLILMMIISAVLSKEGIGQFNPSSIPDLVLHLDAKDQASYHTLPGLPDIWDDKSPSANNVTSILNNSVYGITGASDPLYVSGPIPAVRFSGSSVMHRVSSEIIGEESSIFIVSSDFADIAAYNALISIADPTTSCSTSYIGNEMTIINNSIYSHKFPSCSSQFIFKDPDCTPTNTSSLRVTAGIWHNGGIANSSIDVYTNGIQSLIQSGSYNASGTILTPSSNRQLFVGSRIFNGLHHKSSVDIHEILVYNRALSQPEIDDVNEYLRCKWAINYSFCNVTPSCNDAITGYWDLNGNNPVGQNNFLGSINDADVKFRTTDVERMIIKKGDGKVGIGTSTPTNLLDVNGKVRVREFQDKMASDHLIFGASTANGPEGELRKLPTSLNPTDNFLNEDGTWRPVTTGMNGANNGCSVNGSNVVFGHDVTATGSGPAILSSDREIPCNDHTINFLTNSPVLKNALTVGWTNSLDADQGSVAQLSIRAAGGTDKNNNSATLGYSIGLSSISSHSNNRSVGVLGRGSVTGCLHNGIGIMGIGSGGTISYGIWGIGVNNWCEATTLSSVGGRFDAVRPGSDNHTGVWAMAELGNINIGITASGGVNGIGGAPWGGASGPGAPVIGQTDYAGLFQGDVATQGNYYKVSDERLKTQINLIDNASATIKSITPRRYFYKQDVGFLLSKRESYGFIAQEVEKYLPTLVRKISIPNSTNNEVYNVLDYESFIPFLWKAAQEQLNAQEEKDLQIKAILERLDKIESSLQIANATNNELKSQLSAMDVLLTDKSTIVLNQNVPNPFAESTTISFFIPEAFAKAQLQFTNITGQIIKSVDIKSAGKGAVNVIADDLSSGVYSYSLIIDEKTIETKRMIKE